MESRGARVARGAVVGAFATLVAAGAHAAAGGSAPSLTALVAGLVFATALGSLAMSRRPSVTRLTVAAGGAQIAFHLGFSFLGSSAGSAMHAHGAPAALDLASASHSTDPAMWIAHAAAAVATIVFLRYAELALWSLIRAILGRATRWVGATAVPVRRGIPVASRSSRARTVALRALRSRGPPVPVA